MCNVVREIANFYYLFIHSLLAYKVLDALDLNLAIYLEDVTFQENTHISSWNGQMAYRIPLARVVLNRFVVH